MLSTNEVAQEMGVAYTTVMLWIKQGKLEAVKREHPRGDYYEIPASALKKLDRGQKGRPRKAAATSDENGTGQADQTDDGEAQASAKDADDQAATDEPPPAQPKRRASKRSTAKKASKKTQAGKIAKKGGASK
ncbi:MAG: hypothetical protein MOB07_06675 [Acidobacteria bacterium]|nr:hypothetical protein [Acidobacteriota bacterium]